MGRFFVTLTLAAAWILTVWGQDVKDTEKAAATRKLLQTVISVEYKDDLLQNVAQDLSERVKTAAKQDFSTKIDTISGASVNMKISYEAKNKSAAEILDGMGKKYDLGYVVISGKYKTYTKYDGYLLIRKSSERGFPAK